MIADFGFRISDLVVIGMLLWAIVALRNWSPSKGKATVFVQPWASMSQEQITSTMREWSTEDPRWRALWDWMNEEYKATLLELHTLPGTHDAMMQWRGRMQMLMHLREQMTAWRKT